MAVKELERIIGSGYVIAEPGVLDEYSGDSSFTPRVRPRCIVRPGNVAEVQAVVKWANESATPLVPVSSGGPHFRGDTVPGVDGAVIVELGRMKKIIRIDPVNKLAMVEPGVNYGELQTALLKEGLCAYMPLLPRSTKSVIGSVLEREPITMPAHHWDSTDPLLCAEVVFGTGDRFRTGEASGPDTVEEQWEVGRVQMNPFGHSHVDFQRLLSGAQGTIGIVTWATLKCGYLSKLNHSFLVPAEKLEPLLDLTYKMTRFRLGGRLFIVNGLNLACLLGKDSGTINTLQKSLPPWVLFASFEGYGVLPEEKVAYEEADFQNMAESFGLKPETEIQGVKAGYLSQLLSGPSPEPYWKTRLKGGVEDIFFLTTLDKTPEFSAAVAELTQRHGFPAESLGVYIQPVVQGTSCHCEFNLYYGPDNADEANKTKRLGGTAVATITEMGGFFSRPYGAWKDAAYKSAAGTMEMQCKIKEIFDPNKVLNPGKLCF